MGERFEYCVRVWCVTSRKFIRLDNSFPSFDSAMAFLEYSKRTYSGLRSNYDYNTYEICRRVVVVSDWHTVEQVGVE